MDQQTVNTYNIAASQYQEDTIDFWKRFPKKTLKSFRDLLRGNTVLSIGSGPGTDALILKDMFLKVTCLDASSEMIKKTKTLGFPSVQADLLNLPFKDSSFKGAWAYTSLLHIPKENIKDALFEVHRVLTSDGVLLLGMIEGVSQEVKPYNDQIQSNRLFVYYTEEEFKDLLKDTGFKVFSVDRYIPKKRIYLNILAKKV